MAKDTGGSVFNSFGNKDPEKPESMGDDFYFGGFGEIMRNDLKAGHDILEPSENARASGGAYATGGDVKADVKYPPK